MPPAGERRFARNGRARKHTDRDWPAAQKQWVPTWLWSKPIAYAQELVGHFEADLNVARIVARAENVPHVAVVDRVADVIRAAVNGVIEGV